MARFKDILPEQTGWIHELARSELHPDAEKILGIGTSLDPEQLIEESTVDFLTEIREHIMEYMRIFNGYSEAGKVFQEVKFYNVAQTSADFMIFRSQVKLVFSNSAHGVIQISFARHLRTTVSVDGQVQEELAAPQELFAQLSPFKKVFWTFQGEKVNPEEVAKFYFSEFIRSSRDGKKSKTGNKLLLEQIKTLLQEEGFNL